MNCPNCGADDSCLSTLETRTNSKYTRRRRACSKCGARFSTAEMIVQFSRGPGLKHIAMVNIDGYSERIKQLRVKLQQAAEFISAIDKSFDSDCCDDFNESH